MKLLPVIILTLLFFCSCSSASKDKTVHPLPLQQNSKSIKLTPAKPQPKPSLTQPQVNELEERYVKLGLVNIKQLDTSIGVDLKYGTRTNFMKRNLYNGLSNAYFPCYVALRLCNAQFYLKQQYPHYRLIIFDATRPLSVQQLIWDSVKLKPYEKYLYISPPQHISLHNYGAAVDLSIYDNATHQLIDMGTDFDFFGKLAQPRYEAFFLERGELSIQQFENRKCLRWCMQKAGFFPIATEWWHFNATNKEVAAKQFTLIK